MCALSAFHQAFSRPFLIEPEDIFKIVSFNDVSVVLGRPATLVCYADFIVTGIDVQYTIVKDGDSSYLQTQM